MANHKARVIIWTILLVLLAVFVATIHGFLARSAPVDGEILVVEAWLWNRPTLVEVANEFRRGHYEQVVIVGQPSVDNRSGRGGENDSDLAAERLSNLGLDRDLLVSLTAPGVRRYRTYASAVVFSKWMQTNYPETKAINVFTISVHARRSQHLFRKALGPGVKVGVIAGSQTAYVPWRWWLSFTGIRLVAKNLFGYLYELFFLPKDPFVGRRS